jgi:phage replication O-like protein O
VANPQVEDGYTAISNEVLQALARIRIPGEAAQVLLVIIRKTWGFGKKSDWISLSQFCEATGLHKPNVVRVLKLLESMNVIIKNNGGSKFDNGGSKFDNGGSKFDNGGSKFDNGGSKFDNGGSKFDMPSYGFNKDYEGWRPLLKKVRGGSKFDNSALSKKLPTKETITKERIYIVHFEDIWKDYPNRVGKKAAEKHFNASVKGEDDLEAIKKALANYKAHLGKNTWKQPQNGSTWFNNWRDWVNWEERDGGSRQGCGTGKRRETSADRAARILMEIGQSGRYAGSGDEDVSGL